MTDTNHVDNLLTYAQVAKLVNRSQRTLHRWYSNYKMPPPVKIGERVIGWKTSVIAEWLDSSAVVDFQDED